MSTVSTHVLDAVNGQPAPGISVELFGRSSRESAWERRGSGDTDQDGRIAGLVAHSLPEGTYRITFATGDYFASRGTAAFYPEVSITFVIAEERHYHVPLLLSPFAYSTYRGS